MQRTLAVMALGTLLAGCPGRLVDRDRFFVMMDAGQCPDVETTIFVPTCGGAGCHENPGAAGNLDLVSAGVASRLQGATSTCMAKPMPAYMLEKVKPSPGCGAVMPLGSDPLGPDELKCLEEYLAKITGGGGSDGGTDGGSGDAGSADGGDGGL